MENVLEQLYERQKVLITQLKSVRSAIIGFGGTVSNEELQDLLEIEDEEKQIKKPLVIPLEYNKDLPQIIKIGFALKLLGGEGYVSEIADRLIELEPLAEGYSEEQKAIIRRNTTMLTSYLYRDGRLKARKDGNKYKYRLI